MNLTRHNQQRNHGRTTEDDDDDDVVIDDDGGGGADIDAGHMLIRSCCDKVEIDPGKRDLLKLPTT